ncbi:cyclopropane mycolic acid synthase family methyltransferase [Lolliginicoccus suaedae]|uniref:cyclopropane mycolic acid synthase family methyltransferase n=1 Tax=Lolliginicoccus suaedae TaxID=2605429 RepID=UPI0011EFC825|nr:cyclopropane mycolic acid synthase family methyltransferase [Lolliginicoccus suaedae]
MTDLKPFYKQVQAHYDVSDDFYALFLDPTRTYSCAYFEKDDYTLEQAQLAKVDLSLGKCDLHPGMTLLDVGCGWGTTMRRAMEKHDVNVIGLTLSENQHRYASSMLSEVESSRSFEVRLQGWEEFDEPVDRIVSIGAFEHFRKERYDAFFERCHAILPPDGRMMLHTIVGPSLAQLRERGLPVTRDLARFHLFILREIFPGGQIPQPEVVRERSADAGFTTERVQALQPHYARTLDCWAHALEQNRERAIEITSVEMYDRYMKYLTGCADLFRKGYIDVMQFTLAKQAASQSS